MTSQEFILCSTLLFLISQVNSVHFSDVSNEVFDVNQQCLLAAFGDFNSDKLTDVFCLKNKSRTVYILIAFENVPLLRNTNIFCSVGENEAISGVMPGDFNGDSMMDLLITTKNENKIYVFWGNLNSLNCTKEVKDIQIGSQPLLLDYNGDMIPDLFAEHKNGTKYFWVANNSQFQPIRLNETDNTRLPPIHSCGFLDLNSDMESDLLVTNVDNIEYYLKDDEGFVMSMTFQYPKGYNYRGQSTFVDLDGDGTIEHIMPACADAETCSNCAILVRSLNSSHWDVLLSSPKSNKTLCFKDVQAESVLLPSTLRSADIDMDGTPDFLTIVENSGKKEMILLQNVPCENCPFGRTLEINWNVFGNVENVVLVAFFDLHEDGIMDILLNVKDGSEFKLQALQSKFTTDAYFIKVLVVGGLCYDSCPGDHHPYGTNQPGPSVKYRTTGPKGQARIGAAVQLPQSAHFPLLLPYTVFGLSQTPNFVDEVEIIIPGGKSDSIRKRQLTQIIPNSQIVVIPYPPDTPKYWVAKLFVTPSHLVLMTFAALIGTCLFICIIIGILHWKERRQDKRERLLEAHRFHFDAM